MSRITVATAPGPALVESRLARLVNVIVDPAAAFRGIDECAPWVAAFTAAVALRVASLFVFYRPDVTVPKVVASVLLQTVSSAFLLLVWSAIVWLATKAWRVNAAWTSVFSVVAHVYFVYTLWTIAVASVAGALLPERTDVDPQHLPFTNLAFFIDASAHGTIRRLVAEADVRAAYALALSWVGLRAAVPGESRARIAGVTGTFAAVRLAAVLAASLWQ